MSRVASLFLPQLPIERLRRASPRPQLEPRPSGPLVVDDDPGACSVPRGGSWRPGARWARHDRVAATLPDGAAVPAHQRPPPRELGRCSEAAEPPFRPERVARPATTRPVAMEPLLPTSGAPLVLVGKVGRQQVVTAACPTARSLGLAPGMPATQAQALVAGLELLPAEPDADAALLRRLALHAVARWTPVAGPSGQDGLWLDLTGTSHLFGGEDAFCSRLIRFLARCGLTARVAVAGTAGAAHALARFARPTMVVLPPGRESAALAPLPVTCLRLSDDALAAASRFGLETVADLLPLPRGPLARRLGLPAIERLDQALGRAAEPIIGVTPFVPPAAERRLLEPIGTAEAIATVIADLLADLVERLRHDGTGARALALRLVRIDGSEQQVIVGTSRPTRDARHLSRLLALRIADIDPGGGIEAMHLLGTWVELLAPEMLGASLAGGAALPDPATLVDVLAGRVGARALFRVTLVESDVPERAVRRQAPLRPVEGWPDWARPVRLLARPEPLSGVMALLPDQPPRRFAWRGQVHDVAVADGPERINGEWWVRDGEVWACRDYYQLEDRRGGRFWVFRRGDGAEANTGDLSWWMHGVG